MPRKPYKAPPDPWLPVRKRTRASEFERIAELLNSAHARETLLRKAAHWRRIADQAEESLQSDNLSA